MLEQELPWLDEVVRARRPQRLPVVLTRDEVRHVLDRLLFCVVIEFPGGKAYPVTARDMTMKEKRRYAEWKKR